jgi:prolycopene isomerase
MHAFSGAKIFREFIIDGGYYPEGGMQTLPDAFDYIVRQNGGNILYGRPVKKIILKNNRAAGVQLDTNETVESKYVVSACDMIQTFRTFLKKEVVGEELSDAINKLVPSLSNFILYIGIDKPFQGLPQAGTNTWFLPHYNLDDIYRQVLKGNLAEAGIFMLRVSPDEKTIVAFMAAPFETKEYWHQNKRRVAQFFLERICKQIPDLSQHIACSDAATPSTLFDYTGNYQGAAYGWAKTPSQTFEPVFSRTTGIERLYLTGHWTSLAFGLPGTCYSGQDTAKRILRKAKIMG